MTENTTQLSRRDILAATGSASVAGLAGCSGGDNNSTNASGEAESNTSPIELLHAWSSGDGNAAVASLIEGFQEAHPDVSFAEEPVNGAARGNLDQVISNRLQANDPPSTFQTWPGETLTKFDGAYESIEEDVWTDDLKDHYLAGPKEQAKLNGTYVTVPLNIHRINNLFYNTAVLEEAGVDPNALSSPADVVDACSTVAESTDAIPFAQQTSSGWSTVQLWETTLLAQAGIDGYTAYTEGNGDVSQVQRALESVNELREYYPTDSSSISFTEANTMIIEGDAAFIHQGDWAAGAYTGTEGFKYGEDWNQITYPGTEGSYLLNMDSFPYFANNPSPEATKKFLRYCGSTEGQVRFNKAKGSIPPRKDADVSALNSFQQDQYDDFTTADNQPPSIQHGLAVSPGVATNIGSAFSGFLESYEPDQSADKLVSAFE